ncbi:restriction endonuclease subunit S [Sulfurimonas sp.]|uniref:restriction endonuclease subunit S n=1 Tax=Sulfurimonas sp. TaxID=2022749 RepID=UPI00286D966E|nr:restriction endonuclease subunit S [Sulfurimonas sp.]
MSSKWSEVVVKEVCESVVDCVNKTAPVVDYITPYRMIRTTNVKNGTVNLEGARYVTQEVYEKWTRRVVPQYGDVILTREAPLGEVGMLKSNEKIFLGQRLMQYRANPEKLNNHFLLYSLQESFMQGQIRASGSGSTVEHMRVGDAENLKIKLPHIEVQQKIASILSAYDDLIDNNNRRIAILEEMARSLYREWFVKFRFPGHEKVKMVDPELGQIPEGWEVVKLFDTALPIYGYAFKSSLFNDKEEGIPVVRIRDILKNISNTFTPEHPKKQDQILKNGDLLIGMDGDFHMGKWAGGHAYLNQRVVKITPKEGYSPYFTFLSMEKSIKELNVSIVGTTVAHLGDSHLKEIQIILPEEKVLLKANAILDLLFKQEINLRVRNKNLKTQRDMLLPKLISGKIEV